MEWLFVIVLTISFISNVWTIAWLKDIKIQIMEHNRKLELFVKNTNYCMGLRVNEYKIGYEQGNEDGLKDTKKSIDNLEMID